jgi:hypothetical protein
MAIVKYWKTYGNCSPQMAGFQLAGPAADVSKFLYRKSRKIVWGAQTNSTISTTLMTRDDVKARI